MEFELQFVQLRVPSRVECEHQGHPVITLNPIPSNYKCEPGNTVSSSENAHRLAERDQEDCEARRCSDFVVPTSSTSTMEE